MEVIIVFVSLIGWRVSGFDFTTLFFYIELSNTLCRVIKHYTNDKAARR